MEQMAITLVTDERGLKLGRFTAASLLLTQKCKFDLYIFCHKFAPPTDDPLIRIAHSRGKTISFFPISDPEAESHKTIGHVTVAAMLKFEAVERLLEKYKRVLYTDIDILYFEDIELEKIDFHGMPIAAVADVGEISMRLESNGDLLNSINVEKQVGYFNSGFMMFNKAAWNPLFRENYLLYMREHKMGCRYKANCLTNDQCILNMVFENRWLQLPASYNMQACTMFSKIWTSSPVRHYTGPKKFLPIRWWRNDKRDAVYICKLANLLHEKPPTFRHWGAWLYWLNSLRNRRAAGHFENIALNADNAVKKVANSVHLAP
jgi:lipopolysaccharide biosynthesis glycosyltransferase